MIEPKLCYSYLKDKCTAVAETVHHDFSLDVLCLMYSCSPQSQPRYALFCC
jgi:hypothetical protein